MVFNAFSQSPQAVKRDSKCVQSAAPMIESNAAQISQHSKGRKINKMEGKSEEEGRGILCVPPFLRHHCFLLLLAHLSLSVCSSRTASGSALWQLIHLLIYV